ncbi:hypothetical protein L1987_10139 [Smallanthus sonchifolius]|uniref:Uncharacterized protein n=1 Tax=Smallanthus sonchifolius TaxID=185202 RepID=A0ACB9JRA4_9ASTR|nr:hypothetical protein L1987_10139 [Smallanthus sonchifolius]
MATIQAVLGNLMAGERHVLTAVDSGASTLSVLGCGFIVLCYLCFKELRKFSFKLVFFLALSDMLCSFFSIVGSVISRAIAAKLKIHLLELQLQLAEVGLREGCESFDALESSEYSYKLFRAIELLEQPAEDLLRELCPPPDCIIADFFFPWATDVARRLNIPRLMSHGPGCFWLVRMQVVFTSNGLEKIESDSEPFVLPGLRHRVEVTKRQIPGSSEGASTNQKGFWSRVIEAEKAAHGIVIHTFKELEFEFVQVLIKVRNTKVWCIGPVMLCNQDGLDIAERGNKVAINEHDCMNWLDEREPGSVLVRDRGLIIRGWAPQVLILSHGAIGCFLTHCGWNSTLESICAGVPVVTWPFFADQFLNETFIVEILKIGVRVGVDIPVLYGEEDKVGVLVKKDDVKKVVERLMEDDEEGKQRKASELAKMAKIAMEKDGSSYENVSSLIRDITETQH